MEYIIPAVSAIVVAKLSSELPAAVASLLPPAIVTGASGPRTENSRTKTFTSAPASLAGKNLKST